MSYRVVKSKIEPRAEELLVRPGPYDEVAPGLYPDEAVVELDTGERVAVSVEEDYRDGDLGVNLRGYARWIEDDGSTHRAPDGTPVETVGCAGVAHFEIKERGLDAYRSAMLKMMLGEPPVMRKVENPPDARPLTDAERTKAHEALKGEGSSPDATFSHDPDADEVPLLTVSEDGRASANIRTAIASVAAMRTAPNPAELL